MAWVDIGHGVSVEFREIEGVGQGVGYRHPRPDGAGMCEGYAPIGTGPDDWKLVSRQPLTLEPSLECLACGHHGFIRNGTWQEHAPTIPPKGA